MTQGSHQASKKTSAKVSLCMIVRDEEANLGACLETVRDLVSEIVVVDTGSKDATKAIAERHGARVFDFAWCDDFAAARNTAANHATGDWIFWMDADDRVDEPNRSALRELFAQLRDEPVAYLMRILSPRGKAMFELPHIRLFRNLPAIRWRWPVHEQLDEALREAGHRIQRVPITIMHTGYLDPQTSRRKLERNCQILESLRASGKAGTAILSHLGRSWYGLGRYPEALAALTEYHTRAQQGGGGGEPQFRMAAYYLVQTLVAMGKKQEAAARLPELRRHASDDAALCFLESILAQDRGDIPAAEKLLRHLLDPRRTWVATDAGIVSHKARHNLAILLRLQNKLIEAEMQWKQVVARKPDFEITWAALAELYLQQKRWVDAESAIGRLEALEAGKSLAGDLSKRLATQRVMAEPVKDPGEAARISLCMIVRNESRNLEACLESLRGMVQEVVIVDTGSTDDTKAVAARLGARVFDFPWCDDFSAARNESVRHATGDWIFWMDADDRLDEANRTALGALFARVGNEDAAYSMRVRSQEGASDLETRHIRLFRNLPEIRWRWPVHEQLDAALREAGHQIREAGIIINHIGYIDAAALHAKLERNCRLLEGARASGLSDPSLLYYQARTYAGLNRHAEAIAVLEEFHARPEGAPPTDPLPRLAARQLLRVLLASGRKQEMAGWVPKCRGRFADDAELCFLESELARQNGELTTAEALLRTLLDPQIHWVSADPGLKGFKARHNLGLVMRMQNRFDDAEREWRLVLAEKPAFETTLGALAELLVQQKRWDEATVLIDRLAATGSGQVLAGKLRKKLPAAAPGV